MIRRIFSGKLKTLVLISIAVQAAGLILFLLAFNQQQKISHEASERDFENGTRILENEMAWCTDCLDDLTTRMVKYISFDQRTDLERIHRLDEMREYFYMLRNISERDYNFFLYNEEEDVYLNLTTVQIPFAVSHPIQEQLKGAFDDALSGVWTLQSAGGQSFVACVYRRANFRMGVWILTDDFLKENKDGDNIQIILLPDTDFSDHPEGRYPFTAESSDHRIGTCRANFILRGTIPSGKSLVLLFVIELFLLLLWLQALTILIFAAVRVRRDLLIPMRNLSATLEKYRSASPQVSGLSGQEDENVRETIDDAHKILREMEHNVDDLSTKLYEKQIENQKVELNFRNLQIRPHFIINCFAMLSGMAQVSGNREIKDTVITLSEYFRYILHDSMDMVPLHEEIGHIRTLVDIRSRIRGCRIEFVSEVSEKAAGESVPALLLGSLAENAIRYSANSEEGIRFRLWGEKQADRLTIFFVDNGPGMTQELMDEINSGTWEHESNGHHIGISNMLERLRLIYGGRAAVRFARDTGDYGGTCVQIVIPLAGEKGNDRDAESGMQDRASV